MSTVLWGQRRGDLQYASRGYWRQTIPIGDTQLAVSHSAYFDPGTVVEINGNTLVVTGKEGLTIGLGPRTTEAAPKDGSVYRSSDRVSDEVLPRRLPRC